jgi:hypothetical protein
MNGSFSLIGFVVWVLMLVGIFWIARITPWRPLRIAVNGFGILLVVLSVWQLVVLWYRRS